MSDAAVPGAPPSPSGRAAALRRLAGAPEALLVRARESMTPGQRQTATLVVALALAVVLIGLPGKTVSVPVAAPAAPHRAAAVAPPKAAPAPAAAAQAVPSQIVTAPVLQPSFTEPTGAVSAIDVPTTPAPPTIVALVRSGESPVPGRDDADVAAAFLARSGFTSTTLAYDPSDPAMCTKISAAGRVVVAGRGLEPAVRDCLVTAGEVVVAADALGDQPPASPGVGQVVSTVRGITDSLVDLGRWGKASGTLGGRVGLVTVKSAAAAVDDAKRAMQSMGINVVASTAVADDNTAAADIASAVLDFSSKQVATVVFAAPVADQRIWVNDAALLSPGTRYVLSDAFDSVTNELYPPSFDGALAHTSVRVPWYARAHGTTTAQAACEATWTQTATAPATAPGDETLRVYRWCTNVGLVSAAMRALDGPDGADPIAALRTVALPSALTSDLGPLPNGGFGPTQDAVLVWRATCACWQESTPFASRTA